VKSTFQFTYNPNQTHLNKLINVFMITTPYAMFRLHDFQSSQVSVLFTLHDYLGQHSVTAVFTLHDGLATDNGGM